MLGSLAEGETIVRGLLLGEDPRSTAHCFSAMGAEISPLNSELVKIKGIGWATSRNLPTSSMLATPVQPYA